MNAEEHDHTRDVAHEHAEVPAQMVHEGHDANAEHDTQSGHGGYEGHHAHAGHDAHAGQEAHAR